MHSAWVKLKFPSVVFDHSGISFLTIVSVSEAVTLYGNS